jgi:hypothetical protein
MVLAPKDRGPRLTVVCVRCGGPARLKSVETVMFSGGIQQAIYECDCGGCVKRVLPRESSQALPKPLAMRESVPARCERGDDRAS